MTDIAIYGPLKQTETGPSAVTRGIVDGLVDIGHDVTLYTAGDDQHSRAQTVTIPGSLDSVPNYFRTKRRAAKVIKANDHELFHSLTGLMHGSDVQTVQGIFADLQMVMWSPQIINPREFIGANIYSLLKTPGYHLAEKLVAISPFVANQSKKFIRCNPDRIIPLGVYDSFRRPPENGGSNNILIPGLVAPIKGTHRILQHLDPKDDRFTMDICGSIPDSTYVKKFPEWKHRLHGYVDDIGEYFEKADIVLIPSEHDNYPTTAIEAAGRGCVVILTDTCGFSTFEEVRDCDGIFVVSDGEEMAKTLNMLLEKDIYKEKKAAYELSANMTWRAAAEQYHEVYQEVLA